MNDPNSPLSQYKSSEGKQNKIHAVYPTSIND